MMGGNKCMVLGFACMLLLLAVVGGSSTQALENSVNNAAENQMVASISNVNFTFTSRKLLPSPTNSTAEKKEKENLNDIFNGSVGGDDQDYHDFVGGQPSAPTDYYNFVGSPPDDMSNVFSPPTEYYNYVGTPPEIPTDRIGPDAGCSPSNLFIDQDQTPPMPDGVPTYTVHVSNLCVVENCCISKIHLRCGWYSSARLVDPQILRRVDYDDCLVNDGQPLRQGESLFFTYANTYSYPMDVSSISCDC